MPSISWNARFATGLEVVDEHHKHLVTLLDELAALFTAPGMVAPAELQRIVGELERYSKYHFDEEMDQMAQAGLDARHVEPHRRAHDRFLLDVTEWKGLLATAGGTELAKDLLAFLTHWLTYHVLGLDHAMARQVLAVRTGATPEQAFEGHDGEPNPVVAMLLDALHWNYEVVAERNLKLNELNRALEVQVSERTQHLLAAKEELQRKERRYRRAVDSTQDGFWILDAGGRILEANESYARRSGYSREELATMAIRDVEAVERPEETAVHILKVITEGHDLFETTHRTKAGEVWPVEISVSFEAAEGGRFYAFLRDITDRQAALQALQASEERFRSLFQDAPVGYALTRLGEGRFLEVNAAFAQAMGYTIEDMKRLSYQDLTPPDYLEKDAAQIRVFHESGHYGPYEKEFLARDGARVPVRLNGSLVRNAAGEAFVLTVIEDIRKQKEAEQELKILGGLLPICASCKKIRDDKGYWNQLEAYIAQHSEAHFTHGVCPECAEQMFGFRPK